LPQPLRPTIPHHFSSFFCGRCITTDACLCIIFASSLHHLCIIFASSLHHHGLLVAHALARYLPCGIINPQVQPQGLHN
jgi:hypothetical protein